MKRIKPLKRNEHRKNDEVPHKNTETMDTQLVYDYNLQRWNPYVSDANNWYQHLLGLIERNRSVTKGNA